MKKNILTLFIVATFGISVAEYRMAVPMEVSQGGSLPNGSISFTGSTSTPETPSPAVDECQSPVVATYAWRVGIVNGTGNVIWNGTGVGGITAGATSVSGLNGIVYTKNTAVAHIQQGGFYLYGVCRNIPEGFNNGGTWLNIAPVVSAWADVGSAYKCTWTPDATNFLPSQSVNQLGINCQQKQERNSQARQQNDSTLVIRNIGSPVVESKDVTTDEQPTRTVMGTDTATEPETCGYDRENGLYWAFNTVENKTTFVSWNSGGTLFDYNVSGDIGNATEIVSNGLTYRRSALKNTFGDFNYFELCRVNY